MRWGIFLLLFFGVVLSFASTPRGQEAGKALHRLFDAEWNYRLEHSPEFASELGDRRWNDRWSDESLAEYARRNQHDKQVLEEIAAIDRSSLSTADQLNYDLFKKRHEMSVEGYQFRRFLVPLNQRGGIQTQDELADSLRFETVKDYEDWIARMQAFPALVDQTITLMREGIKERMVHPKVIMERLPAQIDKQIVSDPTESGFYKPFQHFSPEISMADRQRLADQAKQAIAQQVVPAYKKFKKFFAEEYLPGCFD
ncbi:MAG: DUF885 domain-containing protein, partial [Candidatus Angelobacter sp.]